MEMVTDYKQRLLDMIEIKQKLECKAWNNGFFGYIGGFVSGVGFVVLMWLLHR